MVILSWKTLVPVYHFILSSRNEHNKKNLHIGMSKAAGLGSHYNTIWKKFWEGRFDAKTLSEYHFLLLLVCLSLRKGLPQQSSVTKLAATRLNNDDWQVFLTSSAHCQHDIPAAEVTSPHPQTTCLTCEDSACSSRKNEVRMYFALSWGAERER